MSFIICDIRTINCFQMIKLILILIYVQLGHSLPGGAPDSVCTSMMPRHHDVAPKQCQSKYIIQSERSDYNTNEIIRSNLKIIF
jgi:hypothetical protein